MSTILDLVRDDFLPDRNGVNRSACFAMGIAVACEWPEWARAFYDLFGESPAFKEQSLIVLRGFVERHSMEATS